MAGEMTPERLREFAAAYDRLDLDAITGLFDFRDGQMVKKDSYWKIVE